MKNKMSLILGTCGILMSGCGNKEPEVISKNYIHKYGYALSKKEWESKKYPGQVVTTYKDGVTIAATYEDGILNGPYTATFPHSQTIATYHLYNYGNLIKEIIYDQKGIPQSEKIYLSPTRYSTTYWFTDGTPRSIEEYNGTELIDGQYFATDNETEARVVKGNGMRIVRDKAGLLLAKDKIENGLVVCHETFYRSGVPESISLYVNNQLHGDKRTFDENGEPIALEHWETSYLEGVATYFKNGCKYHEVPYVNGKKQGKEIFYIDGIMVSHDILWEDGKMHGQSNYYVDGIAHTEWFYEGRKVSHREFRQLDKVDQLIAQTAASAEECYSEDTY
jgi:antitoxin component YwqK of YwqJK toxin-antitoxin module